MDRDEIAKLNTVEVVLDKVTLEEVYATQHFVCSLLIDNFKKFLDDDSFDKLERQLALHKFLQNNYPLELSRDVVSFVNNCSLRDDYDRIIMEWNYTSSEFMKQYSLYQYDAVPLAFDKKTMEMYKNQRKMQNKNGDMLINIVKLIADKKKDEE